jgi:hypothetical protein
VSKPIQSERLTIALCRFRRARRHLVDALKAECPGRLLIDRRHAFLVTATGRLRQFYVTHLTRPVKVAPAESVNGRS